WAELLETVLRSACELLDANGGSMMLVEGDELVTLCVRGREEAVGARLRLGEGVAGHVALRREPVLIEGHVDPQEFPGLADRAPYVESAMSLPRVHRDEGVGVLDVNAAADCAFTEYDLAAVPIVVCSAKKDPEDMERARQLGASGYIVKPFDIDRLIDAVLEATGRSRKLEPGRATELGIERPELA